MKNLFINFYNEYFIIKNIEIYFLYLYLHDFSLKLSSINEKFLIFQKFYYVQFRHIR